MPGTRPTSYRRWQRMLAAADDRAAAIARRRYALAGADAFERATFQAALGKLTNWQRSRYQVYGIPGDLENVRDYAGMQRATS